MENILFIIDRLELKYFEFNQLVTNFWMIKTLLESGTSVHVATIDGLGIANSQGIAKSQKVTLKNDDIFLDKNPTPKIIETFDLVVFRPDPPVDIDYINATYVFDFVKNTPIINSPQAIRNFNEKLHLSYFNEFAPENILSSDEETIHNFVKKHKKAVIKPLNRCFGSGVFVLDSQDINLNTLIKTATNEGKTLTMVQEYLKSAPKGDKRVMILGEEVLEECVIKAPLKNDFKFSTHNDSCILQAELTEDEKFTAKQIAKKLNEMGLPLVGLDMLEGKVIEINVTSPCYFIKESNKFFGTNIEQKIANFLKNRTKKHILV